MVYTLFIGGKMPDKRITDRNTGRKSSKAKRIFEKIVEIRLVGGKEDDLQAVAHKIHSAGIAEVTGGKLGRTVTMTHTSTKPKQIYFGRI